MKPISSIHKWYLDYEYKNGIRSYDVTNVASVVSEEPRITLTSQEEKIFQVLKGTVDYFNLGTTIRVAGGWVRDKLMGRESKDIDIAIDNMMGKKFAEYVDKYAKIKDIDVSAGVIPAKPEQGKHLETAVIHMFGESIDVVNLRDEEYDEESRKPVVTITDSPMKDAFRRDLTINALFYNIHTGEVEDFTSQGMDDIQNKVLRTPQTITEEQEQEVGRHIDAKQIYLDDPLRVMRAIRFANRYPEFTIDPEIPEAARDPEVQEAFRNKITWERRQDELAKIMSENRSPREALELIKDWGYRSEILRLPEEYSEWELDQNNPHHELNVWGHLMEALDNIYEITKDEDLGKADRYILNWATLLHDVGKLDPRIQGFKEQGDQIINTFHGHEDSSIEAAQYMLRHLKGTKSKDIKRIQSLIDSARRVDLDPNKATQISAKAINKILALTNEFEQDWKRALQVALADAAAHRVGWLPKFPKEGYEYLQQQFQKVPATTLKPLISGIDLQNMFTRRPGRWIGQLNQDLQLWQTQMATQGVQPSASDAKNFAQAFDARNTYDEKKKEYVEPIASFTKNAEDISKRAEMYGGWLAPNGKFYEVKQFEHAEIVNQHPELFGNVSKKSEPKIYEYLFNLGWIRFALASDRLTFDIPYPDDKYIGRIQKMLPKLPKAKFVEIYWPKADETKLVPYNIFLALYGIKDLKKFASDVIDLPSISSVVDEVVKLPGAFPPRDARSVFGEIELAPNAKLIWSFVLYADQEQPKYVTIANLQYTTSESPGVNQYKKVMSYESEDPNDTLVQLRAFLMSNNLREDMLQHITDTERKEMEDAAGVIRLFDRKSSRAIPKRAGENSYGWWMSPDGMLHEVSAEKGGHAPFVRMNYETFGDVDGENDEYDLAFKKDWIRIINSYGRLLIEFPGKNDKYLQRVQRKLDELPEKKTVGIMFDGIHEAEVPYAVFANAWGFRDLEKMKVASISKRAEPKPMGVFAVLPKALAKQFPSLGGHDNSDPHVTVLYIGKSVKKDQYDLVQQTINRVLENQMPFTIEFDEKVTYFPATKHSDGCKIAKMKVLSEQLHKIHKDLKKALIDVGIPIDDHFPGYNPHITLEYMEPPKKKYDGQTPDGAWLVDSLEIWGCGDNKKIKLKKVLSKRADLIDYPKGLYKDMVEWISDIKNKWASIKNYEQEDGEFGRAASKDFYVDIKDTKQYLKHDWLRNSPNTTREDGKQLIYGPVTVILYEKPNPDEVGYHDEFREEIAIYGVGEDSVDYLKETVKHELVHMMQTIMTRIKSNVSEDLKMFQCIRCRRKFDIPPPKGECPYCGADTERKELGGPGWYNPYQHQMYGKTEKGPGQHEGSDVEFFTRLVDSVENMRRQVIEQIKLHGGDTSSAHDIFKDFLNNDKTLLYLKDNDQDKYKKYVRELYRQFDELIGG